MSDEARELNWDGWLQELGKSGIPDVVTTLDDLLDADDCIERVMKTNGITWTPGAHLAFQTVQQIVRDMREKILAIPMREEG